MKTMAYEKLSFAEQVSVHLDAVDFRIADGYPFADVWDFGDDVRLIVEDEEARSVRVIVFSGTGRIIENEATFSGVTAPKIARYMQEAYR